MKRYGTLLMVSLCALAAASTTQASLCNTCAYITGSNHIYAWDPTANTLTIVATTATTDLDSLVFDKNGNIIVDSGNKVYIYDSTAQTTSLLATLGGLTAPDLGDMAMEPSG